MGTILDPGKVFFGHFIYFGHVPIEIPIEAKKIYQHGKELSYRENKICSETSEAVGISWEHAQLKFQNFLKIRIPLIFWSQKGVLSGPVQLCLSRGCLREGCPRKSCCSFRFCPNCLPPLPNLENLHNIF